MLKRVWRALYEKLYVSLIGAVLKLRYNIKVEGVDTLSPHPNQGILFLSNHVAEIDPVIIEYLFWPRFHVRPLAVDYLFNNPIVRWFLNSVGAVPVPSVIPGRDSAKTLFRVEQFYANVVQLLDQGGSVLLYPSGKLSREGKEDIVNQYSAYKLLHQSKACNVYLVRISGLWGSIFSRYWTRSTPKLGKVFKQALFALLRRGFFLCLNVPFK